MNYIYWIHRANHHYDFLTEGYIGVSNDPSYRLVQHKKPSSQNPHLTNAFMKYDDIVLTILWEGPEDECYIKEEQYRPQKQIGWNIAAGGNKPSHKGYTHTKISKQKISMALKGKLLNIPLSEEHKQALRGPKRPGHSEAVRQAQLRRTKHPMSGKKQSEETRRKMSEARSLYWAKRKAA